MTRLCHAACIAVALAAMAVSAQFTETVKAKEPTSRPKIGKSGPVLVSPRSDSRILDVNPATPQARMKVTKWPDRGIVWGAPLNWQPASRHLEANYPHLALAISYARTSKRNPPCETFYDRISLADVRARGFRLVGFEAVPLYQHAQGIMKAPVEAIAVNSKAGDFYTADLRAADQIRIRPPTYEMSYPAPDPQVGCWAGYGLSITLEGPAGKDPFGPPKRGQHRY